MFKKNSLDKDYVNALHLNHKVLNKQLKVSNCIATWTDICGFGNLLEINNWELNKLQQSGTIILLNDIYKIAGHPKLTKADPLPNEKVIVLNDGIATTLDLKYVKKLEHPLYMFEYFSAILENHNYLLSKIKKYNVGIRTILAGGERIHYSPVSLTGHSFFWDFTDRKKKELDNSSKKFLKTTFLYNPAEFQMNTAFAKAFTIDSLGSKSNIRVNGLYIEDSFLSKFNSTPGLEITTLRNKILVVCNHLTLKLHIFETLKCVLKGLEVKVHHITKYEFINTSSQKKATYSLFRERK